MSGKISVNDLIPDRRRLSAFSDLNVRRDGQTGAAMKYWIRFLREKRKIIFLYLATLLLFFVTGSLWHMENVGKLAYAALLTFTLWAATGVLQGQKYVRGCRELEAAAVHFEQSGELNLEEICSEEACGDNGLQERTAELLRLAEESRRREQDGWEQKEADRRDYYLMWTHQIKTPISALKLLVEENSGCRNSFLMQEELFKIEQYVEMVLTFQRLEGMASDLVLQEYELAPLLRQAVRKYSVLFINKGLSVELPEGKEKVLTDEKWFSFCLEQLLSNSIKYTERGGIRFLVEEGEREIRLSISDTGIGIRPEDLPRIFEKGFTGYNGRLDKKSTGIGLYLCRRVFERLGINVSAESSPGLGTSMALTLPKAYKNVSFEKEM